MTFNALKQTGYDGLLIKYIYTLHYTRCIYKQDTVRLMSLEGTIINMSLLIKVRNMIFSRVPF